ncbi:hypothetical protein OGAPHI_007298 [Ogataea philodendri]|uniref:Uncharacterized protein n=1 Tax=Ogataea philodendri TaxID=1378263 RepID=A0A9P8SYV7_9ASCO|nr:uncharacterized protein OGAPHI_007298 [Ogataea philodendri]KAH3660093.1 hypothetical protein OGAPHI_007298 [Ogataea philodendri]
MDSQPRHCKTSHNCRETHLVRNGSSALDNGLFGFILLCDSTVDSRSSFGDISRFVDKRGFDNGASLDNFELLKATGVNVSVELDGSSNSTQNREEVNLGDQVVVDDHQSTSDFSQRWELDGPHVFIIDHTQGGSSRLELRQLEVAESVVDELGRVLDNLQAVQVQVVGVLDGDRVSPSQFRKRNLQVSGVGRNQQSVGDLLDRGIDSLQKSVVVDVENFQGLHVESRKARQRGVTHHHRVDVFDSLIQIHSAKNREHFPRDGIDTLQLRQRNRGQGRQSVESKRSVDSR